MNKEQRERLLTLKSKLLEMHLEIDSMRSEDGIGLDEDSWMTEVAADLEEIEDKLENCLTTQGAPS